MGLKIAKDRAVKIETIDTRGSCYAGDRGKCWKKTEEATGEEEGK
jgi:hypothetical protein